MMVSPEDYVGKRIKMEGIFLFIMMKARKNIILRV